MAVAFVSATSQTFTSGGTAAPRTLTVNAPASIAAGNLWVVGIVTDNDPNPGLDVPSGWTAIAAKTVGQEGYPAVRFFWKTLAGGETTQDFVISGATTYDIWVVSIQFSGHDTSTPIADIQTSQPTGTSDTIAAPTVTVGRDGSMVVQALGIEGGSTDTITAPSGTDIASRGSAFPTAKAAYIARNSGSYSAGNWTVSRSNADNQDGNAWSFVIQPPAAATFPPVPAPVNPLSTILTM